LGAIPDNAYQLASIGLSLAGLVSELNKKVADIPTLDIKNTYDTLSSLNKELDGVVTNMESARQGMENRDASIDSALKDVRRQVVELTSQQNSVQRALVESVQNKLSGLQQKLDGLDSSIKAGYQQQMNQIQDQLKQIQNRTILDLFRGHRGTGN
jgi:chromosome segregation ATPase